MSTNNEIEDNELELVSTSRPAKLEGYPSFAQFIATDSDAAIYRKYAHLSARNLLYLQSELNELEARIQKLDREDAKDINNEDAQKVAREWAHYSNPNGQRASQHRLLQGTIRAKVKEYRT